MKKTLLALLLAMSLVFLCACSDNKPADTSAETTVADQQTQAAPTEADAQPTEAPAQADTTAAKDDKITTLPLSDDDVEFSFLSGAGGWRTELELERDGTFEGEYSDSELGSFADEYPNGTYYICEFKGRFTDIEKINDYSYRMKVTDVETKHSEGKEWVEEGIRYIATTPNGIDGGEEFILYLPDAPMDKLPAEFLDWYLPARYEDMSTQKTLGCYGIHNVKTNDGFFSE